MFSEKEINNIKSGQECRSGNTIGIFSQVKGKNEELSMAADAKGKYSLKTYIDNSDGVIKPGMFANVTVSVASKNDVMVVPTDAVVFHGGKNVVYLVQDNLVAEREVSVGLENGTETELLSGLSVGDVIVVKGQSFVSDGSEIKVITKDGLTVDSSSNTASDNNAGGGAQQ